MQSDLDRIKTLIDYNILDTSPEEMFDDITAVASAVCGMPVALISLLDLERQFFKSNHGFKSRETPIEHSFCKLAIETPNDIFIVEDARIDSRFKENPLVVDDPNIVSYYGVPLNSKSGVAYGTLCVIDNKVNVLTDHQKEILKKLSKQVEHLLELRKNNYLLAVYQDKIERYSSDMEEFAYLAAHDLKSPIRAIDSFVKLLDKKHKNIWDERDEKYVSFIVESTTKMNHLIHDLLEYSKSTFGIENDTKFDVKELISDIFRRLTYDIQGKKPELICDEMPIITNSKIAFTLLFHNLISNGLKYQNKKSTPLIKVHFRENVTHWIFSVEDNGIGIKEDYFQLIFKPFKRLHNALEYQGTGLGLAACVKVIDKLQGSITVDSIPNKGTTFTFSIPKK
ncbi:ATP-binding protein [Flavobacterium sp.]|uniref:GAF domain-containing sensor histidine kinase n=1 Tax=Flavobacterium sp. TaxID=239 RepID=UPI000EE9594A|nr:ATP-binding protein [Flavobacterium sp.]HCQ12927.1 histidine kinase [Flavobacterium sp.]